jgi:polyhydroxybutyrate depolymerase
VNRRLRRKHVFAAVVLLAAAGIAFGSPRAHLANLLHGGTNLPKVAGADTTPVHMSIDFGGKTRTYWLYRPPSSRRPSVPLLINLPGHGFPNEGVPSIELLADKEGLLAAFPETESNWKDPADQAFVGSVIDDLVAKMDADPARVYVTGGSAGGFEAYRVACGPTGAKLAGVGGLFAGIVTPGPGEAGIERACNPPHPLTVVEIHGTADSFVPYDGRPCQVSHDTGNTVCQPSQLELMQFWAHVDGCGAVPSSSTQGSLRVDTWQSCRAGTGVQLNSVTGADHNLQAVTVGGISPIARLWSFFSAHAAAPAQPALQGRITSGRVVGTGAHRTLVVVVNVNAAVVMSVTLRGGAATVASSVFKRSAGTTTLKLRIRAAARPGSYALKVTMSGAEGRKLVLKRTIKVPS